MAEALLKDGAKNTILDHLMASKKETRVIENQKGADLKVVMVLWLMDVDMTVPIQDVNPQKHHSRTPSATYTKHFTVHLIIIAVSNSSSTTKCME